jgi:hypothetical protein
MSFGVGILVQNNIGGIAGGVSIVIYEEKLDSLFLQRASIIGAELVPIHYNPRRAIPPSELCCLFSIACAPWGNCEVNEIHMFTPEPFLDRGCRIRHGKRRVTTCILPCLRQGETTHHVSRANRDVRVGSKK